MSSTALRCDHVDAGGGAARHRHRSVCHYSEKVAQHSGETPASLTHTAAALRAARTAPPGTQPDTAALRAWQGRGRCDHLAAEIANRGGDGAMDVLTSSRRWVPAAVLAARLMERPDSLNAPQREALSQNPRCPAALLALLAQNPYVDVSDDPAANPRSPRPVLIAAAADTDRARRAIAGKNPACPEALRLGALATDPEAMVRFPADRGATSGATLAMLAADVDSAVRRRTAENRQCPPVVLALLAEDTNPVVRIDTARNPRTSRRTLARLVLDHDTDVRRTAQNQFRRMNTRLGHP